MAVPCSPPPKTGYRIKKTTCIKNTYVDLTHTHIYLNITLGTSEIKLKYFKVMLFVVFVNLMFYCRLKICIY